MTGLRRLETFRELKKKAESLLSAATTVVDGLAQTSDVERLKALSDALSADTFKVLIIGEFKRGKSTLINALLGEDVLPSYSIPCTAVINEIKWSDEKRACVHFNAALSGRLRGIPDDVRQHIIRFDGINVPPMQIDIGRLAEIVTIPDPARDQAESVSESPYRKIEVFWPLSLCHNGVEIIDSPGLNEHGTRTRITTDYLHRADAVVFVLSCSALASQSELRVIDNDIRGNGHEEIFFVCNRVDEIKGDADKRRIAEFAKGKLADRTVLPNGVFLVSASNALKAKQEGDEIALASSQFTPFEDALAEFLVENRGRVKLLRPLREIRHVLRKQLDESIPQQRCFLEQDLCILRKRFEDVRPCLDAAEKRRSFIQSKLRDGRTEIRDIVRREVLYFVQRTASYIPDWLRLYEPTSKIEFLSLEGSTEQSRRLVTELAAYVAGRVEDEQTKWSASALRPLVMSRISEMCSGIKVEVGDFFKDIEGVRCYLTDGSVYVGDQNANAFEKVMAATSGWFIGGPGSALVGATLGFNEMFKSLVPNIALGAILLLLGVTNPFALLAALVGAGGIQGCLTANSAGKKLKDEVGRKLCERVRDSGGEVAEKAAEVAFAGTQQIEDSIDGCLRDEIAGVRESVTSAMAEKEEGEANVKERVRDLDKLCIDVNRQIGDITDFLESIAR